MTLPKEVRIDVDIKVCRLSHPHPSGAIVASIRGKPFDAETAKHYRDVLDAAVEAHSTASFRLGHGAGWTDGVAVGRREGRREMSREFYAASPDKTLANGWAELNAARAQLEADQKAFLARPITINIPSIKKTVTVRNEDGSESVATIEPVAAQGAE
jgi:hypothetical protein